jgi:hypothetical protein
MLEASGNIASPLHLWLDLVDKLIKLVAVMLGGIWTYWNFRKSRTYAQRLELTLTSSALRADGQFLEVRSALKNLGASRHVVEGGGTYCEVTAVFEDESEKTVAFLPLFLSETFIEPGETISDLLLISVSQEAAHAIWLRINLRVVSDGVEWRQTDFVRWTSQSIR